MNKSSTLLLKLDAVNRIIILLLGRVVLSVVRKTEKRWFLVVFEA